MISEFTPINFWKRLLFVIILCLVVTESKSQEVNNDHRNFLTVSLTQLIYLDFQVSYERRIRPSHGIRLEFSYKPVLSSFTDATIINLGQNATGWCYRYTVEWYYISLGYRYYFNKKKTLYCSPEIFCKTMSTSNIIYSYGEGGGQSTILTNIYEVRSMKANVIGMNFLIGKRFRIRFTEGFHMGFDIFSGLSVRYKSIQTLTYGSVKVVHYHDSAPRPGAIPISENPLTEKKDLFQVSPQFGILLYVSWK